MMQGWVDRDNKGVSESPSAQRHGRGIVSTLQVPLHPVHSLVTLWRTSAHSSMPEDFLECMKSTVLELHSLGFACRRDIQTQSDFASGVDRRGASLLVHPSTCAQSYSM